MRITENLKSSFILSNLSRSMERMLKTQNDLSTAKRIHKPSDDPTGTLQVMKLKSYLSRYERYQKNVEDAYQWMVATEYSLTDLEGTLTEVNSILIRANNDTIDETERINLSHQMQGIWDQIVQIANQKYGDKYLFGGTQYETPPYSKISEVEDETFTSDHGQAVELENVDFKEGTVQVTSLDGLTVYSEGTDFTIDYLKGTITVLGTGAMADATDYLIDYETLEPHDAVLNPAGVDGDVLRKVDEGLTMKINISAEEVFGGTDGILDVVKQARIDFVRGDRNEIKTLMSKLDERISNTSKIHNGEVGVKINRMETLKLKITTDIATYQRLISNVEDTDIASAMVELESEQMVYQAALRTGAKLIQSTLLDFLS